MSQLDLRIKRPLKVLTEADWEGWTSEAKVISDTLKNSGLQDKSVAIEIGIDPGLLSKSQTGLARLSEQHMDALMTESKSFSLRKRNSRAQRLRRKKPRP